MTCVEESRPENPLLRFRSLFLLPLFHNVFLKHFPSPNISSALNTDLSLLLASVIVIIAISRIILQMKNIFSSEKETPYFSSSMYPSLYSQTLVDILFCPDALLLSSPLIASASSSTFYRELFENKEYIPSEAKHDKSRMGYLQFLVFLERPSSHLFILLPRSLFSTYPALSHLPIFYLLKIKNDLGQDQLRKVPHKENKRHWHNGRKI